MSIYKYVITEIPPSNNKYIGRNKRWEYQEAKKQWAILVKAACKPLPQKPIEKAEITLHYFFRDKRRRDPDNYSGKMILDGLVRAGAIADDSFEVIGLSLLAETDKNKPRVEITIKEQINV